MKHRLDHPRNRLGRGLSALVILLALAACKSRGAPPQVQPDEDPVARAEILGRQQYRSLQFFERFLGHAEREGNILAARLGRSQARMVGLAAQDLSDRLAKVEVELTSRFDTKAWDLLGRDFEQALENKYRILVEEEMRKARELERDFRGAADRAPRDVPARLRYQEQKLVVQELERQAVQAEADLRKNYVQMIRRARQEIGKRIEGKVEGLQVRVEVKMGVDLEPGEVARMVEENTEGLSPKQIVSFGDLEREIGLWKDRLMAAHEAHQKNLAESRLPRDQRTLHESPTEESLEVRLEIPKTQTLRLLEEPQTLEKMALLERQIQELESHLEVAVDQEIVRLQGVLQDYFNRKLVEFGNPAAAPGR